MKKMISLSAIAMVAFGHSMAFAQDIPLPAPEQSLWQTVSLVAIAIVSFYLILWRPEQKRRKMLDEQRNIMKKGDRVYAMGIVGTVSKIQEQTVILRMVDGTKIEVLKAAITDVMPGNEEDAKKVEKD